MQLGFFFKAVQNIIHLIIFFILISFDIRLFVQKFKFMIEWFSIFCLVLVVYIFHLKITEIIDTSGLRKINIDDSLIKLDLL